MLFKFFFFILFFGFAIIVLGIVFTFLLVGSVSNSFRNLFSKNKDNRTLNSPFRNGRYYSKKFGKNSSMFGYSYDSSGNQETSYNNVKDDPNIIEAEVIKETFVNEYISKIENANVSNQEIKEALNRLVIILKDVDAYLVDHADKSNDFKLLCDYYIPEVLNNLDTYSSVAKSSLKTDSVETVKNDLLETINMITEAFKTILQEFYDNMLLNASASLEAIKANIKMKGFAK